MTGSFHTLVCIKFILHAHGMPRQLYNYVNLAAKGLQNSVGTLKDQVDCQDNRHPMWQVKVCPSLGLWRVPAVYQSCVRLHSQDCFVQPSHSVSLQVPSSLALKRHHAFIASWRYIVVQCLTYQKL